jgi:hypothetical protein
MNNIFLLKIKTGQLYKISPGYHNNIQLHKKVSFYLNKNTKCIAVYNKSFDLWHMIVICNSIINKLNIINSVNN